MSHSHQDRDATPRKPSTEITSSPSTNPSNNLPSSETTNTSSTPPKAGDAVASTIKQRNEHWCNQWYSAIGWTVVRSDEVRFISENVMEHTKKYTCPQKTEQDAIKLLKNAKAPNGVWHQTKVAYLGAKKYTSSS